MLVVRMPPLSDPPSIPTRRDDLVETLFGHRVADPYRWLEQGDDEQVKRWTDAQNERTRKALLGLPNLARIRARLAELLAIGTLSAPVVRRSPGGAMRYFHTRREGRQNQPVLYVRDGRDGEDRALADPNQLSSEGTVALDWWAPSNDGALLVYGLSQSGDEESTLFVRDVSTATDLEDRIERTRFASIAWLPGGAGFFYTRYPEAGTVPPGEESYHRTVYRHRLGDDPKRDPKIFEGATMTDSPGVVLSPDGRWLVVAVHQGWARTELYLRDLSHEERWVPLAVGIDAVFDPLVLDDVIYVRTNDGAPHYRLFAVEPARPERSFWREIVTEGDDVLQAVAVVGDDLIATYLSDASSRIVRYGRAGEPRSSLPIPTVGSVSEPSGLWDGREVFYEFSSYAVPPTVFRCDLETGRSDVWQAISAPIAADAFEIERVRAPSKDGTPVPMFLVRAKDAPRNADTPALLIGYGGFGLNTVPAFSRATYLLLERGGTLAFANLRGGGEFGESWHKDGMLENKQNVFDDAIACAEHLVREGYTSRDRLAIMGGSNGGLLVGAVVTQRPELVRAAVCSVPLLDMVRYHRFRIAKLWIPEYGSPDDPKHFEWLFRYSPYHRVQKGTAYPAVLITTAEGDTRVDPLHARKMTAALQAATSSGRPVLLRVETKAGHGAGKPVSKLLDELVDVYGFLFAELGVAP
jgi:prolyl oligopeptidase